jgi:ribosomal protein S18 acetylase RimI-like enzyme
MALRPSPFPSPITLSEADAPRVASLYERCADYFLLQDGAAPSLADARELFTDVPPGKEPRDQIVLGWRRGGDLDAIAAILRNYPRDGIWYLGFMIVDPGLRGRDLGRSIYAAVEELAAAGGATEIRLAVLEANEAGERFWRSLGFSEVRRVGPDRFKLRKHWRVELSRHIDSGICGGESR